MTFNLGLEQIPDAALPALQTICDGGVDRAPVLFGALRAAVLAEVERRSVGASGHVEMDVSQASIADLAEAIAAATSASLIVTRWCCAEPDDDIAAGWASVATMFLNLRAALLASADPDELRAFRLQTVSPQPPAVN